MGSVVTAKVEVTFSTTISVPLHLGEQPPLKIFASFVFTATNGPLLRFLEIGRRKTKVIRKINKLKLNLKQKEVDVIYYGGLKFIFI